MPSRFSPGALPEAPLTPAEQTAFLQKIWPVLARQASLFTMGDSTSLPIEQAQELADSLLYTLGAQSSSRVRALLAGCDLEAELAAGRQRLLRQVHYGKALWQFLHRHMPPLANEAIQDSFQGIGQFFDLYDIYYAAHRVAVPVLIDYPLSSPVPETVQGIDYITEWLRRFAWEACLLRQYPAAELAALMNAACPGWKQLPVSLYELAATNALGRALAGLSPESLYLSRADLQRIAHRLEPLPRPQALAALFAAADTVCRMPPLHAAAQRRYLGYLASQLYPRIQAALPSGQLDGVFPPLAPRC